MLDRVSVYTPPTLCLRKLATTNFSDFSVSTVGYVFSDTFPYFFFLIDSLTLPPSPFLPDSAFLLMTPDVSQGLAHICLLPSVVFSLLSPWGYIAYEVQDERQTFLAGISKLLNILIIPATTRKYFNPYSTKE